LISLFIFVIVFSCVVASYRLGVWNDNDVGGAVRYVQARGISSSFVGSFADGEVTTLG
jgi:hypothetical protein